MVVICTLLYMNSPTRSMLRSTIICEPPITFIGTHLGGHTITSFERLPPSASLTMIGPIVEPIAVPYSLLYIGLQWTPNPHGCIVSYANYSLYYICVLFLTNYAHCLEFLIITNSLLVIFDIIVCFLLFLL